MRGAGCVRLTVRPMKIHTRMKVRMKIGEHEFEAEGRTETVQRHFELFVEMLPIQPAMQCPSHTDDIVAPD